MFHRKHLRRVLGVSSAIKDPEQSFVYEKCSGCSRCSTKPRTWAGKYRRIRWNVLNFDHELLLSLDTSAQMAIWIITAIREGSHMQL